MTDDLLPPPAPSRPLWLITLADLALLLVGFFVLIQANTAIDPKKLAEGIRAGFGATDDPAPLPVAASALAGFAPGAATLPHAPADVIAWVRGEARDPRVVFTVTGHVDGTAADVDAATGSGAILAADRARALAAALAPAAGGRLIVTTGRARTRGVTVTLGFAGEPGKQP